MIRYMALRAVYALMVVFGLATATFFLIQLAPGGPSVLVEPGLTPEQAQVIRAQLGLDRGLWAQYVGWLGGMVQLDLGRSFTYGQPVLGLIGARAAASALLVAAALALATTVGILAGALASSRPGSVLDRFIQSLTGLALATPNYWLAVLAILLVSVILGWLPATGASPGADPVQTLRHLVLPAAILAVVPSAEIARYARTALLKARREDYVTLAVVKGLSPGRIFVRHVLRTAMVPIVTAVGLLLARLAGGSVIVETIFSYPGLGQLAVIAAGQRDYPLVVGVTVLVSIAVVVSNLAVDLLYGLLDPRIRAA